MVKKKRKTTKKKKKRQKRRIEAYTFGEALGSKKWLTTPKWLVIKRKREGSVI